MKIVLLAQYNVYLLKSKLKFSRNIGTLSCSWIVNLVNELAKNEKLDIHLITLTPVIPYSQIIKKNNIKFHILKNNVPFTSRGYPYYFPFNILTEFYFEKKYIINEINKINPDIIHAFGTEGPYAMAGVSSKYPCIISIQGIINEIVKISSTFRFKILSKYELKTIKKGVNFSCRTNFDSNFVKSNNNKAKIFKVFEAINPVYFNINWQPNASFNLVFVGSIIKRKGIEILLEAISIVKNHSNDILLYLIGSGTASYFDYLIKKCKSLKIEKNIQFLSYKTADEISNYHLKSQLFVFPSEIDNSPNSIAEAMVSGMPIIASNVGGIPSMIEDNKTGILIKPDAPEELAEKIIYLFNNPYERKRLGDNAKNLAREIYLPKNVAKETLKVYKEIIES